MSDQSFIADPARFSEDLGDGRRHHCCHPACCDRLGGRAIRQSEAGRSSQDQARNEYIVRFPEADRGRCAQCRLRRGGPGRWSRGPASSRLAV